MLTATICVSAVLQAEDTVGRDTKDLSVALDEIASAHAVVGYAIGALKSGRNQDNARRYLEYLASDRAQEIYSKYGFVEASAENRKLRPIPAS